MIRPEFVLWKYFYVKNANIEKYGTSRHFTHTGGPSAGRCFLLCIHMVTSSYNYTGDSLYHIHISEGIIRF